MTQATGQVSTSDVLRGVRSPKGMHPFEPSSDPRRAGCFKQLRTPNHRWYCGELATHPIHQVNEDRR